MERATADIWYETRKVGDDVTYICEPFIQEFYRCNIWHVRGRDKDMLVDSGMGVVIEDDVYRNHASYLAWGDCLGIGDDLLYLKPKRSYTVQWKIYPVAQKDYYQRNYLIGLRP